MTSKAALSILVLLGVSTANAEDCNAPFLSPQEIAQSILSAEEQIQVDLGEETISEAMAGGLYAELQIKKDKLITEVGPKAYQKLLDQVGDQNMANQVGPSQPNAPVSMEVIEFKFHREINREKRNMRGTLGRATVSSDGKKIIAIRTHNSSRTLLSFDSNAEANAKGEVIARNIQPDPMPPRFRPHSHTLIARDHSSATKIIQEGQRSRDLEIAEDDPYYDTSREALVFSPDGEYLLSEIGDGQIYLWNDIDKHVHRTFSDSDFRFESAVFTADGQSVLLVDDSERVHLINIESGEQKIVMDQHSKKRDEYFNIGESDGNGNPKMSLNSDGKFLEYFSLGYPKYFIRWNIEKDDFDSKIPLAGDENNIYGFDPLGRFYFYSVSDFDTGENFFRIEDRSTGIPLALSNELRAALFAPDGGFKAKYVDVTDDGRFLVIQSWGSVHTFRIRQRREDVVQ